jgi:hypothetical protein
MTARPVPEIPNIYNSISFHMVQLRNRMATYTNHDGIGKKSLKRDRHCDDDAA